jgi:hypothetical protein
LPKKEKLVILGFSLGFGFSFEMKGLNLTVYWDLRVGIFEEVLSVLKIPRSAGSTL